MNILLTAQVLFCLEQMFIMYYMYFLGGTRGVMVIVVGNGHGDTSSNPGQDWLHFT